MPNRIGQSSTRPGQNDELNNSFNSDGFDKQLTDLARYRNLPPGDLPEGMGCCASNLANSTSSPRMSTSVFQYRTAELRDANVQNICVGLVAGWLSNLAQSPSSRMAALSPGSNGHRSAARSQQRYEDIFRSLREDDVERSEANFRARATVVTDAGFFPSNEGNTYAFGDTEQFSELKDKIVSDGRTYLLSLSFERDGRQEHHLVATSASDEIVTLFDPNYGEFTIEPADVREFFRSLANRYRSPPNRMELLSITTQRVRLSRD
ncbi:YopT-type cysteine protease domain-containing protein [Bradyrhizobium arachidis]|uniref:YopT-type cysteine protease domain-containing protein n=1 Tax=Bradyrhizobium arachidis TaxID=858423 RepID=UPI0021614F20|nr:YopT-type cysteine protease domain-containing protein [Bradyrhizobium arachidis]UVO30202.1 YopT-type cysteine protease domain-containing protein [Bradyrhizobium arachidis]